jgi:hypothetical protein
LIALSRRSRGCITLLFFFVLLGMQQEFLLHALSHFKPAQEQQELSAPPNGGACLECALLATGSSALPSSAPVLCPSPGAHVVSLPAHVAPILARFTPHCSRAPPSLS